MEKQDSVFLKIDRCDCCCHLKIDRVLTADSFENITQWKCMLSREIIDGYIDTFDPKPKIPRWCQLRRKGE
jgi:hypothetical protein